MITTWEILAAILQSWLYISLFLIVAIVAIYFLPYRSAFANFDVIVNKRYLGGAILIGLSITLMADILLVGQVLNWSLHPSIIAVEDFMRKTWHFLALASFTNCGLGITILIFMRMSGAGWKSIGFRAPDISMKLMFGAIIFACIFCCYIIAPIAYRILPELLQIPLVNSRSTNNGLHLDSWLLRESFSHASSQGKILIILWIGFLDPLIEEVFYRGILLKELLRKVPAWIALSGQALLFAAMHLDSARFLYLVGLGLTLGYLVKRTSSLLPAVILHVILNVLTLIVIWN